MKRTAALGFACISDLCVGVAHEILAAQTRGGPLLQLEEREKRRRGGEGKEGV